jgi:hypothetical protein
MSAMDERALDQLLDAWMDLGPTAAPDRVAEAARLETRSTRQTAGLRGWPPRRFPEMNNTIRFALAAAVLAGAVVLGYTYVASRNIGDQDPIALTPSPEATATPSAALLNESEGPLEPGAQYLLDSVSGMRIYITAPENWVKNFVPDVVWHSGSVVSVGFGTVGNLQASPCAAAEGEMEPPVGPSVSDLVEGLGRMPDLEMISSDVTVSGFSGTFVELTASDPIDGCLRNGDGGLWAGPGGELVQPPGPYGRTRLWIVDVDGTRLVIGAEIRSAASLGQEAQVQTIIDTLRIETTSP